MNKAKPTQVTPHEQTDQTLSPDRAHPSPQDKTRHFIFLRPHKHSHTNTDHTEPSGPLC